MTQNTNETDAKKWPWWKTIGAILAFLGMCLYAGYKMLEAAANGALK